MHCIQREKNFRIHIVFALYALYFSKYYAFTKIHYIVLCILFAMVIMAEMINTAIEQFVDIETDVFNFKAKSAKDIAAGAVLVCAFFAVIIGIILYFDMAVISRIFNEFLSYPIKTAGFVSSLILSVLFVKFGVIKNNKI
jgi:diacylglycerol kinase (ATP)